MGGPLGTVTHPGLAPSFLIGPLIGLVAYIVSVSVFGTGRGGNAGKVFGRRLVLASLAAAPSLYGLLLLLLAGNITAEVLPLSTISVIHGIGQSFSITALLTTLGMAYQASRIFPALERKPTVFGRNLVLQMLPLSAVVFGVSAGFILLDYVARNAPLTFAELAVDGSNLLGIFPWRGRSNLRSSGWSRH